MIDIPGYEGLYKLDLDLQQVYSIKRNKYLKPTLDKGSHYIKLCKNGKKKRYNMRQLSNMCNLIENNNLVDISGYEGIYKFDTEIEKVYNIKKNKYLKNTLNNGFYYVSLYKNKIRKTYTINNLVYMYNPKEYNNLEAIPGYDNYKFDNELLQVYNLKTDKYLNNYLDKGGYYMIGLCKNGKEKRYGIHQLVYIINNPTEDITGFDIDHIDGNKTNNKIENLRKATRSDNCSNAKTYITNKSTGIKYISKNQWNTYVFKLQKNGIRYSKNFKTLEEAIEHRDRVVLEKCGEFANLG